MKQNISKYKVLDVFSGAGGFSLGFSMAGCEIIGGVDIDKWALDSFSANHKDSQILLGDISAFSNNFIESYFQVKPDIIIGGPPCQGYSICNKNAGDPKDPRNSLFKDFLRFAKIFDPQILIMENVANIINAKTQNEKSVIEIIKNEFKNLGYFTYSTILHAGHFGVPQKRQRFFLIASKNELLNPFPSPTHYFDKSNLLSVNLKKCPTLWEAISDLPQIEANEGGEQMEYTKQPTNEYQRFCRQKSNFVFNHLAMKHSKRVVERFKAMQWGQSISDIQDEALKQRKRNGNGEISKTSYDQNNRRMYPNDLCNTITASFYGNFVHPYSNRNFTAREGARIQSFPDSYVFKGKPTTASKKLLAREGRIDEMYLCQYSQIGNAVPPLLSFAIAKNILNQVG